VRALIDRSPEVLTVFPDGSLTPADDGIPGSDVLIRPLRGQRVVVVGGTSGMGFGAVRAAAAAGADVVVADRRPLATRDVNQSNAGQIRHVVVDIADEASVRAMFEEIGELDHLFVTAAPPPGSWGAFLDQDVAGAQAYMNGKFFGSWACARYAAPRMRAGGSITFLTGGVTVRPRPGLSMVTATFAALEALSRALALELGPLRVNTIRPGLVDSEMWDFLDEPARQQLLQQARETFPARRVGAIEDIGHAAVFLMTNPYVTGAVLEVSGGETLVSLNA
jgi:NAD(P)-dependent dehydrogenase (short-subunit alcohol dehydrogenase family)